MESDSPLSQEEIARSVRSYLAGDSSAFEGLFHAFRYRLTTLAVARLGPGPDAEDCVQEAFVRAARYLEGYDEGRPFQGWLIRILTNVVTDRLSERWPHRLLAEEELRRVPAPSSGGSDAERMTDLKAQAERARRVRAALDDLPEVDRRRVLLFYFHGLSHAQIARSLCDPSEEASRQRLKRVRDALRTRLSGLRGSGES